MGKKTMNILIFLTLAAPAAVTAGALERYQVPEVKSNSAEIRVEEKVYTDFRNKAKEYSPEKREKLKAYYRQKMKQSVRERNFDAASHYQKLLDILNSL
ncbi:hypothetical protein [Sulfurimonas sp. HSL3-7]|uniref:hypothetical protein n=1 Tax=Sulfonitrofixus jiaomeiensis TaxID=3131938 RepID=UPI0031F9DF11